MKVTKHSIISFFIQEQSDHNHGAVSKNSIDVH